MMADVLLTRRPIPIYDVIALNNDVMTQNSDVITTPLSSSSLMGGIAINERDFHESAIVWTQGHNGRNVYCCSNY